MKLKPILMWLLMAVAAALYLSACSTQAPVPPAGDLSLPVTTTLEARVIAPEENHAPVAAARDSTVVHDYVLNDVASMRAYYARRDNVTVVDPDPKDIPKWSQECAYKVATLRQANEVLAGANGTVVGIRKRVFLSDVLYCPLDKTTDALADQFCTAVGEGLYKYSNSTHTIQCRASH